MLPKTSVRGMSLSSGLKGSLWSSSCYETFELYTFFFVCFFFFLEWGKTVLSLQTFPSSVILNPFPPLSPRTIQDADFFFLPGGGKKKHVQSVSVRLVQQ